MKFYKCAHCGQIIAIVKKTGVPVICCGEPMTEMIPGTSDGAVEKHVPVYEVADGNTITTVREKPQEYNNAFRGIGECVFKRECLELLDILKPNPRRGELEMGDWIQLVVDSGNRARVFDLADAYINVIYAKDIIEADDLLSKMD